MFVSAGCYKRAKTATIGLSHTLLQLLQEHQHVPLQHKTAAAIAIEPTMTIARVTARTTTRATTPLTTLVMIQSQL